MPYQNHFRHQDYSRRQPLAPYHVIRSPLPCSPGSVEFRRGMERVGQVLRSAGVRAIYLVHGTFAGSDLLGLARAWERLCPHAAAGLRRGTKYLVDRILDDSGNFTAQTAGLLSASINAGGGERISVRRLIWSGENHHVGRAEAAIGLANQLARDASRGPGRILLWGHSHSGNVFALLTNLVGANQQVRQRFFQAASPLYDQRTSCGSRVQLWTQAQRLFSCNASPWPQLQLDLVTLGTPIRYGWDTAGYANLLHIIHHRPLSGYPSYITRPPTRPADLWSARAGDYVHQLGVAGSDFPLLLPLARLRTAERNLRQLLDARLPRTGILHQLEVGQRVPDEGTTLLVTYPRDRSAARRSLAGHGVYTRPEWLLFHAQQTVQTFYESDAAGAGV